MKKFLLVFCSILIIGALLFVGYKYLNGQDIFHLKDVQPEKKKEEEKNIYYDSLITLGYNESEVNYITKKFSLEEIKNNLLETKYDSIKEYSSVDYFKLSHLSRYKAYDDKTEYDKKDVVMYVEIGLDQEFYTNIKEVSNPNDVLVLVNKYNKLPENFSAEDIVKLDSAYRNSYEAKLKSVAYDHFKELVDVAKEDGIKLRAVSTYRTQSNQNNLFNGSKNRNGLEHALMYSAKPAHSEHQTGYALDINSTEDSFANTSEYTWLINNSYKYGFIERYPKGKEFITGYGYEPWHYRYVGIDIAKKIVDEKITFEEYCVKYLDYSS